MTAWTAGSGRSSSIGLEIRAAALHQKIERMRSELFFYLVAFLLVACDGDGCNGGPHGPATKFCQETVDRYVGVDGAMPLAEICKSCCIQEVPYVGRLEDGKCVCRR